MTNPFFKNNGPISILEIIKLLNINPDKNIERQNVEDVKDLHKEYRRQRQMCIRDSL